MLPGWGKAGRPGERRGRLSRRARSGGVREPCEFSTQASREQRLDQANRAEIGGPGLIHAGQVLRVSCPR